MDGIESSGRDRGRVRRRERPVDMRMKLEFLVPGMEHAEEADLGSEMGGVACDLQQGFGAGPEQQTVDHLLVLGVLTKPVAAAA